MEKLLIGSPIKQKTNILKEFLLSLKELNLDKFDVTYFFIDDNTEKNASDLLKKFASENKNVIVKKGGDYNSNSNQEYSCDDTHHWKKKLIERIILFKNDIINYANKHNFDYMFLVDSDIVLNPETLNHLRKREVDIVSNVFWTSWAPGDRLTPQVWLQDESNFYVNDWDNPLTDHEKKQKSLDFIAKMKIPGLYEVGGLGACTLISKTAIKKGISFSLIPNVSFWGEDRHFCIRAEVLGLKLYVDTVYPAYHIYREHYLSGVEDYKKNGFDPNTFIYNPFKSSNFNKRIKNILKKFIPDFSKFKRQIKEFQRAQFLKKRVINKQHSITLSMLIKNSDKKYFEETLKSTLEYVDDYVIIDNTDSEETIKLVDKILEDKNTTIAVNRTETDESKLRLFQWNETIKRNPDFILFQDANELFDEKIKNDIKYLIKNDNVDVYCFENEVSKTEPLLIRYQPKFRYKLNNNRMPTNILDLNYINTDILIKKQ